MKILHVAPNSPYNDYWGYQENLLPKYQKKMGHDVTIITTNTMHENNHIVPTQIGSYVLNDGVVVIRKSIKNYKNNVVTTQRAIMDIKKELYDIQPDFIFFHGLVSETIFQCIEYKTKINKKCVIVQDNHMDWNIGYGNSSLKEKIIQFYHRVENRRSIKYVEKVYGVTPWRKKYAEEYFGIPNFKTDVLIMGADDEEIHLDKKNRIRAEIRGKHSVKPEDFLIVTGGKIDAKKKIELLMEACSSYKNVKLLIFGNVSEDVKLKFDILLKKYKNLIYIGWVSSDKVYDYFFAADLVFFPGQHSVLWEQACASKVPCVFERWDGMEHVNNGGNSDFVENVNVENLSKKIKELLYTEKYFYMKKVSESDATDIYLYSRIAEKSLECVKKC